MKSRRKPIQTSRDSLCIIWRGGSQLEAAVLMHFTHPCACSIGSLYLTAPAAEFPTQNWSMAHSYLVLQCLPGNGAGLGPREEHREESPHTRLLGAALRSWALTACHGMTRVWPAGNCICCSTLLQWHLSLCSSWHGKYKEVMSANTSVFKVLNTLNQDLACFDKVNYPFWNVLGSLPCSFSWALFVLAGCCFNTAMLSGAFKFQMYCTCRTHCNQLGSPENIYFRCVRALILPLFSD